MSAPLLTPERDGISGPVPPAPQPPQGDRRGRRRPHGRPARLPDRWREFRRTPLFPATVLTLLTAAVAGLLAGTYSYVMAKPEPRTLPVAVVGDSEAERRVVGALDRELRASLVPHEHRTLAEARTHLDQRKDYAVLYERPGGAFRLETSGASGASVAEVLAKAAPHAARDTGARLTVRDVHPPQPSDPKGIALFYLTFAAVMIGFLGAGQLSAHAPGLLAGQRIGFTAAFALLGGLCIYAVAEWWLGVLAMPFPVPWLILSLTMFASGMVFTMFGALLRRWALLPTYGLMVLLGAPSCGGSVPTGLLPRPLAALGCWLPQGAAVDALSAAVYFPRCQPVRSLLVLGAWAAVSCAVFWAWRHRHPGGPAPPGGAHRRAETRRLRPSAAG
ncbi:ABC transporter permease [Streptomyces sp. ODS28]|uniref:ABC transporter permease n=1 Tax=Streptomyces sp. ODS28 TaxID=3136688 RepID=UPI0031EEDBD9